jgi:hypothetical protein
MLIKIVSSFAALFITVSLLTFGSCQPLPRHRTK